MQTIVKHIIKYCLCAFATVAFGQQIQVKEIPHFNQLPSHVINTIFQDTEGYIWYGTDDGLCRNDGYDIYTFRSDFKHPDVISSNMIHCIAEDSVAHHLWIGTDKGLHVLNKQDYTFTRVETEELKGKSIDHILVASDHSIWISCYRMLYHLDSNGQFLKSYPLKCVYGPGKEYFLYEDREKQLLLSLSDVGLYKWNPTTADFELYFAYPHLTQAVRINSMVQDTENGCYWLASWYQGVIRLAPDNPLLEHRFVPQTLPILSSGAQATTATNILQDDVCGYLWTTSWSDLITYRITTDGYLEQVNTSGFLSPQNKAIRDIIKDKEGNLWVTAFDDYNFIIHFNKESLFKYDMEVLKKHNQWTPIIQQLCVDETGVFWLYQQRLGLSLYWPEANKANCYKESPQVQNLPLLVVLCMLKSQREGWVWVAPQESHKVYAFSQKNMQIQIEHEIDLTSITHRPLDVLYLFEDIEGNLWFSTNEGLYVYRIQEDKLKIVIEGKGYVCRLTQMHDGTLWGIVKNKGLIRIDRQGKTELHPFSDNFLCITALDDRLWLGTDKGNLLEYDPESTAFKDWSTLCGMNGNKIYNLLIDHLGHIWILTSQEIKELDPQNKVYRSILASNENIGFNRFLPSAIYKAPDGCLYFGGVAGLFSILPTRHMKSDRQQTAPLITDIRIMDRSILLDNQREEKLLNEIKIYPNEQNLEIHFSSLDYQNSRHIRYAYQLSGVDKDWIYLPTGHNYAFYNKLAKGDYTFQVKATDRNGLWGDQITELHIQRLPAWYETGWAYTLYICIVLGVTCYFYRMIRNRIRLRNALQLQKLEQAKTEEINHAKLQFFTNITHELLTPLSILSAAVDDLKQTAPVYKSQYALMTTNINRLVRLLQQILEFRKAETGNLKLRVSQQDLAAFIRHHIEAFTPLLKKKDMQFLQSTHPDPFIAWFDTDKLDKILYNLLSNSAKYSRPGEMVQVELTEHPEKKGFARLIVKDNGPGIPKEAQKDLFKRFYEGKHREFHTIGTGIGLSLVNDLVKLHHGTIELESEEGQGTAFTIYFPFGKEAYSAEEIDLNIPMDTSVYTDEEVSSWEEEEEKPATGTSPKEKAYTLLLVEDNEELVHLIVKLLSNTYNLLTASNGKEALEIVEQNEVDVIISDIMMPVMDGIEFCRHIKGNFDTCHIPVLLLTAKKQEEDRVEAYQSGADAFLNKPFSLNLLQVRIENLLAARERQGKDFRKQLVFETKETDYTSMDQEFLQKAIDCVNRHLDNPDFTQDQFVDELHISKSTSLRKLKSLTGQSFVAFVRNIRMKAACRLMEKDPHIRISELAYAVGYNDPRYFTVSFKKEFDITPQEYLQQVQEKRRDKNAGNTSL